jgi:hypothetical protein
VAGARAAAGMHVSVARSAAQTQPIATVGPARLPTWRSTYCSAAAAIGLPKRIVIDVGAGTPVQPPAGVMDMNAVP